MTTPLPEVLSCPACGCEDLEMLGDIAEKAWWIECRSCGTDTNAPVAATPADAIRAWNKTVTRVPARIVRGAP